MGCENEPLHPAGTGPGEFPCVHCGFVATVSLDSPRFGLSRCPVCNAEIGPIVEDIFTHLQQARLDAKAAMSKVSIEFELEDES